MHRYAVLAGKEKVSADRKDTRAEEENGENICFNSTISCTNDGKYNRYYAFFLFLQSPRITNRTRSVQVNLLHKESGMGTRRQWPRPK